MTITEPATLVTDYLLAGFTGALAWRLLVAARERRHMPIYWWSVAFGATAIAGVAGGTVHGFRVGMRPSVTEWLWLVAIEGLVVAAFAVVGGTLASSRLAEPVKRGTQRATAVAYAVYGLWVAGNPQFLFAIAAYGAALVVLVVFKLSAWRTERAAARWMTSGVLVSAVAAAVQQTGWSLHPHFNHNDLYHVIQAVGIWLLYRGASAQPDSISRRLDRGDD